MNILNNSYLILIARLVIGVVFIMFGIDKISAPKDFAMSIMKYEMMPVTFVNIFALALAWIEVVVGICMVLGVRIKANALVMMALNMMFISAISYALLAGLNINCGCSANSKPISAMKLLEDGIYLALALLVYMFPRKEFTLEWFVAHELESYQTQAQSESMP
jgi:putative oxidoreductase